MDHFLKNSNDIKQISSNGNRIFETAKTFSWIKLRL